MIELGTSFIGTYGYGLVRTIREAYPELSILADVKIVDGGYGISKKVFDLGANYSTVVGYADLPTLAGAVRAAKEAGAGHYIMADMMHVPDYAVHKEKLDAAGVDYVSAHVATDAAGFQKFEDVPCPIPPPPPSMFPLPPDANAVEGTRQNTRARLHKRARSRFKYITLHSF